MPPAHHPPHLPHALPSVRETPMWDKRWRGKTFEATFKYEKAFQELLIPCQNHKNQTSKTSSSMAQHKVPRSALDFVVYLRQPWTCVPKDQHDPGYPAPGSQDVKHDMRAAPTCGRGINLICSFQGLRSHLLEVRLHRNAVPKNSAHSTTVTRVQIWWMSCYFGGVFRCLPLTSGCGQALGRWLLPVFTEQIQSCLLEIRDTADLWLYCSG